MTRMLGNPNSRRAWVAGLVLSGGACASAQQPNDLLRERKQQYEQTTRDLQQRIAALEQQIEKQNQAAAQEKETANQEKQATVSAAQLAAENAVKKVGSTARICGRDAVPGPNRRAHVWSASGNVVVVPY